MQSLKHELTDNGTHSFKVILGHSNHFMRKDGSGVYQVEIEADSASAANAALCSFIKAETHAGNVQVTSGLSALFKKVYVSGIPAHH